jgi:hypothetical protein
MPDLLSNRISLSIPDDDMQAIRDAIKILQDKLADHLVDLDADQRVGTPKMGTRTVDFVTRTLTYAQAYPQFVPPFVDVAEFERDLSAFHLLGTLQQPLAHLVDMLSDSVLQSGSEAYTAALASYQAVKSAAKLNQPGAAIIVADLSDRLPRKYGKRAVPSPTPAPQTSPPAVS